MLAVQTADHLLYVPLRDIASITPVYPNRSRVVLADGTVAHRPGHTRWLNPDHLTRTQNQWQDPANYLYPDQPLPEFAEEEEEESALDPAVCWLERVRREVFWHTDSDVVACENPFDQVLKIYPELCQINRNQAVSLGRLRRIAAGPGEASTVTLDTGAQLVASPPKHPALAQALGCDTLKLIDADDSPWLAEVRDTPYDMLTTTADRLRADFPNFRRLVLNLLWRSVLLHQSGQLKPTLKSSDDLFFGPVSSLAQKLGYPIDQNLFENTFKLFISREALANFRQLGFADPGPQHRHLGARHPDTVLLAPLAQKEVALAAAEQVGMSCYLAQGSKRLHLEFFAQALLEANITRIRLLAWQLDAKTVDFLREDLEQCDLSVVGPVHWLEHPEQVPPLQPVPPPQPPLQPDASSRLALQCERGLLLVEPGQIASWVPARPSRWRVVTADGNVAYHPGPVPPGPWVPLGPAWVRPQLLHDGVDPAGFRFPAQPLADAPEPTPHSGPGNATLPYPADQIQHHILRLERRNGQVFWHLEQGRQIPAHLPLEEAAQLHPGMLRLNHDQYFNRHRLRSTYQKNHTHNLTLDDGTTLSCRHGRYNHQLADQLGLTDLFELEPDQQLLRRLQIRDYPYEIARAKAPLLKADFATSDQLIVNVLWHSCATLLLVANVPAKIVAERLGHASVTQTLDTYSHVLPALEQKATVELRNLLFPPTP